MNNPALILFLFFSFALNISAQVPDNFEFLNHRRINTETTDLTSFNDKLIAAGTFGVDLIEFDNRISFTGGNKSGNYKLIGENDTTIHYVSWVYFGSDFIDNSLGTLTIVQDSLNFNNYLGFVNDNIDVEDITYDSIGGWWCIVKRGTELVNINNLEVQDEVEIQSLAPQQIFTSCNYDIFIMDIDGVKYFDGSDLSEAYDHLPRTERMLQYNGFNYLLYSNKLYQYDCDLQTQLHEWTLPFEVSSFNQVTFLEDKKLALNLFANENYTVRIIDANSDLVSQYDGQLVPEESITGIHITSDSSHIVYGNHQFELTSQPFYRNVLTTREQVYPTVDVTLSEFKILYEKSELELDVFGDSIIQTYKFDLDVLVDNLDQETIYALNIYSSEYYATDFYFVPIRRFFFNLQNDIASFQELVFSTQNNKTILDDIINMKMELTGANYKFLKNGPVVLTPDLLTKNYNIDFFEGITIYPNPTTHFINVNNEEIISWKVLDAKGSLVLSMHEGTTSNKVDVSSLMTGEYFLLALTGNDEMKVAKFIKL